MLLLIDIQFILGINNVFSNSIMVIQVLDYQNRPLSNATIDAAQRGVNTWEVITNATGYAVLNGVDFSKPIGIFIYYLGREVYSSGSSGLTPQSFIKINVNVFDVIIKVVDSNFRGISNLNVSLSYSTLFNKYVFSNVTGSDGFVIFNRLPNGTYDYVVSSDKWGMLRSGNIDINNVTYNNIVLNVPAYELTVKTVDINDNVIAGAKVYVYYGNINVNDVTNNDGIAIFKGLPSNRAYNIVAISGNLVGSTNVYLDNDKIVTLKLYPPNLLTTTTTSTVSPTITTTSEISTTTSINTPSNLTSKEYSLSVNVRWSDGESVAGANVNVYDLSGNRIKSAIVATGSVKFLLSPGEYIVNASLYGASSGAKVSLFSDVTIVLILNMSLAKIPTYEFKLKVVWFDGNPVDNVLVHITKSNGAYVSDVITDNNGVATVYLMGGFVYNYNATSSKYGVSTTGWFPLYDQIVAQYPDGYLIYLGNNPLPPYINILFIIGIVAGYALSVLILFGRKVSGIVKRRMTRG